MCNIKHVCGTIYMSEYSFYSKRYKKKKEDSGIIFEALKVFTEYLDIEDYPTVLLRPLRQNLNKSKFRFYGFLSYNNVIVIDPRFKTSEIIRTLAHECIHYKQVERGDLSFNNKQSTIWKGEYWPNVKIDSSNLKAYKNLPWEIEAFRDQGKLVKEFTRRIAKGLKLNNKNRLDKTR